MGNGKDLTPMTISRVCRSALFMPAINARALAKARSLPCDCVILDLEDAVAPERKAEARAAALKALNEGGFGARLCVVRINDETSLWGGDDLAALAGAGADALLLPKVEDPATLSRAKAAIQAAGGQSAVWAMIETPRAALGAAALGAVPGLQAFVMGTNDLALGLRLPAPAPRAVLAPYLAHMLLAARAHDLLILDGVFNAFADEAGFAADCEAGRAMGFDGKTLIHPAQIAAANRIFSPDEAALAEARAIVDAFAAPEARAKGVVNLNGRMVERLHLKEAERILNLAQTIR
jgi:citrate lyase subunit beta/citryl-CoA lyase